jgi:hypothetical protein
VRRILLAEKVRWRHTRSWLTSHDPDCVAKERRSSPAYVTPPEGTTTRCVDELGPVIPRAFPPAPGWSPDGHRIKYHLEYLRGPDKVWMSGALRVQDGQELTLSRSSRTTVGFLHVLKAIHAANPPGELNRIAENLSRHDSAPRARRAPGAFPHPSRVSAGWRGVAQPAGAVVTPLPPRSGGRAELCHR